MLRNLGIAPAAVPGQSYDSVVLADSPKGFWKLNETSGTTAADSSGNGYNGTYTGGYTLGATGIGDGEKAVTLNGTSGYINVTGGSGLILGSAFTLECWLNMPSVTAADFPMMSAGTNQLFDLVSCNALRYYGPPGGQNFQSTSVAGNTSVWQYLTARYDGSTITLRLNTTDETSHAATGSVSNAGGWTFGYFSPNSWYANGTIAKVAIYNYALTTTQLNNHYNAQTSSGSPVGAAAGIAASQASARAACW